MFKLKRLTYVLSCAFILNGCASSYQSKSVTSADIDVKPITRINHANGSPKIFYLLGRYYQGKVDYAKAIEAYKKALDKNPEYVEVHNGIGVIYSIQGNYQLALQHFQKAIELAPDETYLHNNLGYAYLIQGQESEAAESLRRALQIDPGNMRARSNLAIAFERVGLNDEAEILKLAINEPDNSATAPELAALKDYSINTVDIRDIKQSIQETVDTKLVQTAPNIYEYQAIQKDPIITVLANVIQAPETERPGLANYNDTRVEISNGNGITGMAKHVSHFLEFNGFNKSRLTNYQSFQKPQTEIYYRSGNYNLAKKINTMLPRQVKLVESNDLRNDIQVKIVLGRDYSHQMAYFTDKTKIQIGHQGNKVVAKNK